MCAGTLASNLTKQLVITIRTEDGNYRILNNVKKNHLNRLS